MRQVAHSTPSHPVFEADVLREDNRTSTATVTVTSALPTFLARIVLPSDADFNVLTRVASRDLATTFSLTCEGFERPWLPNAYAR